MSDVPSNLIPTRITQLPDAPEATEEALLLVVIEGNSYKIRAADLLQVAGVPTSTQVIAGTGMTGGGQLTGNVTLSIATAGVDSSLMSVTGATAGSYGSSTQIPVFTVDAAGRITAVSSVAATVSGYVPESRQVIAGDGLTGGGALNANVTLTANFASAVPLVSDGTGSAGAAVTLSRGDHQHPATDLADDDQVDGLLGLDNGGTNRSLTPAAGALVWCGADGLYVGPVGLPGQVPVSTGSGSYVWGSVVVEADMPANVVFAGPTSGPDAPTAFRALVNADLPNSGATAASYGSATVTPVITFNAKGVATITGSATIAPPFSAITATPTTRAGYGITDAAKNGANSDITSLTGLTTPLTVLQGGTGVTTSTGTGSIVLSNDPVFVAPALGTPASGVATNLTGTAAGLTAGNVTTNANLTGDVTSVGNATTLTNAPVIAKVLTGYTSGAGVISSADSILSAIQKLNGNDATNANLTGPITSTGNATAVASQTGTGSKFVMDNGPTLVAPILGTPTSGVATNLTGLPLTTGVTGTLGVGNGGTGLASTPSNGQIDIGNGTNFTRATLTQGANVTITNGAGSITIAAAGLSFSALTYSTAGTLTEEPFFILAAPTPSQIAGVVGTYSGKWAQILIVPIVNDRLTSLTFTDLEGIIGTNTVASLPALTTLSFPALLISVAGFSPSSLAALTTLSAPVIEEIGGAFSPTTLPALTTLTITGLKKTGGGFTPSTMAVLTTLSAPALTMVNGAFAPSTMAALTTFSFSALATISASFSPSIMAALTTISMSALTDIAGSGGVGISVLTMASLTSLSFGALVRVGANITSGNAIILNSGTAALTTFTINASIKQVGTTTGNIGNVVISSCALDVTSVNNLLIALAGLDGTNGTIAFSSRTVTITGTSAAPTGAGITAAATLVVRGCTVTTN